MVIEVSTHVAILTALVGYDSGSKRLPFFFSIDQRVQEGIIKWPK